MADWCRRHKLPEQERAHLLRVLAFIPDQPSIMQRLGMVQVGGAWLRPRELQQAAARAKQASLDLKHWVPRLEKLRAAFFSGSGAARERAARQIRAIHDPGAIPAMELVLSSADEDAALAVIDAVSQMRAPQAAVSLARHAVFSDSQDVIDEAIERLKQCPEDSYVATLLAALATPLAVQTAAVPGPGGRLIFRQAFYSEDQNRRRLAVLDDATLITGANAGNAEGILTAVDQAEGEASAKATGRAVVGAVQSELTSAFNKRICDVLRETTGQALPDEPQYWWYWWNEHNEIFQQGDKPYQMAYACEFTTAQVQTSQNPRTPSLSKVDHVSFRTQTPPPPPSPIQFIVRGLRESSAGVMSCFVAGTPVWTDRGAVAVELVQIGDRVLAQDPTSGELAYQPVIRTTVRPKAPLIKIRLENETLRCTGGHPFWVDGRGWVRARYLEPGMLLHQVRGAVRAEEVKPLTDEEKTYNLVVDEFHDYFVGASLVLVHDNTVRQPTGTAVPGLPLEAASKELPR